MGKGGFERETVVGSHWEISPGGGFGGGFALSAGRHLEFLARFSADGHFVCVHAAGAGVGIFFADFSFLSLFDCQKNPGGRSLPGRAFGRISGVSAKGSVSLDSLDLVKK